MAWLDWYTGVDTEEVQKQEAETARRDLELQQRRLEGGKITTAQYAAAVDRVNEGYIDVEAETNAAFQEGLEEGYENTTGFIKKGLALPFDFLWKSIPWQLLLVAGVAAFFYFGGSVLVRRWLTKAR